MEGFQYGDLMVCPSGTQGGQVMKFEMKSVIEAEERLGDVARVNHQTAPHLLAVYNQAFLDLGRHLARLKLEHVKAVRTANIRKAIVTLDVAPRVLAEKQLVTSKNPAGSADLREAVLDSDVEYGKLMDRVDMIAAVYADMQNRQKSIEMSYTAVKRIIDRGNGQSLGSVNTVVIPNEADIEASPSSGDGITGRPRYGRR